MNDPTVLANKVSDGYRMVLIRDFVSVCGKGPGYLCLYQELLKELEAKEGLE